MRVFIAGLLIAVIAGSNKGKDNDANLQLSADHRFSRLRIKITDAIAGKSATQTTDFVVQ